MNTHVCRDRGICTYLSHWCLHSSATACEDGDVRPLLGGPTPLEGLVEVCVNGNFHFVDLSTVTIAEANVLCRQLNLSSGMFGLPIIGA